jgi:hypothetical protein
MSKKKEEIKINGQVEQAILALIDQQIERFGPPLGQRKTDTEIATEGDEPDYTVLFKAITDNIDNGEQLYDTLTSLIETGVEDADISDRISDVVDEYYIQERIDMSDLACSVEENIDWDCRISENIDVASAIMEFIDDGCNSVDDYCKKIVERGMGFSDVAHNDIVMLSADDYNRIMEVVDFIRPVMPADPTPQDLADQLVAKVDTEAAINLVGTAAVSKAQADAQAVVDAATSGDSE